MQLTDQGIGGQLWVRENDVALVLAGDANDFGVLLSQHLLDWKLLLMPGEAGGQEAEEEEERIVAQERPWHGESLHSIERNQLRGRVLAS